MEDEEGIRIPLAYHLEGLGYEVLNATNGVETKDILYRIPCGLVITDLRMPISGGIDILRIMRVERAVEFGEVPVILMTARHLDDEIKNLIEATGPNYIVRKPFNIEDMGLKVTSILG